MSKYCEECAEISMWNLYKDMSFAAKCKYYERKIKFLPVTSQVKSKCSEIKSSSYIKRFMKKTCYEVKSM